MKTCSFQTTFCEVLRYLSSVIFIAPDFFRHHEKLRKTEFCPKIGFVYSEHTNNFCEKPTTGNKCWVNLKISLASFFENSILLKIKSQFINFFALLGTFSSLYSETTRASLAKILSVLDVSRQALKPLARSIFFTLASP